MKRADMVCKNCINYEAPACHLSPTPAYFTDGELNATDHWCAQGVWRGWVERFKEYCDYYWGEWEDGRSNDVS